MWVELRSGVDTLVGRPRHLLRHLENRRRRPSVADAVAMVERNDVRLRDCDDRPVFVLSAGWRSGSTLLQRLIMSSGEVFVWGEPYDRCDTVRRLADSLRAFDGRWPAPEAIVDHVGAPQRDWIANLYPPASALVQAHRALVRELFARPLEGSAYRQWGFKEVRLGAEYARYLRLLFPKAKFLFLHRSPYEAYRSYYHLNRVWYDRWPSSPILRPGQFGEVWRRLVTGFHRAADELGALIVRYDDLITDDRTVKEIEAHLGLSLDRRVLDIRATGHATATRPDLPRWQRHALRRAVEPVAGSLGYWPDRMDVADQAAAPPVFAAGRNAPSGRVASRRTAGAHIRSRAT